METKRVGVRGDRCSWDIRLHTIDDERSSVLRMILPHSDTGLTVRRRRCFYDSLAMEPFEVSAYVGHSI